MGGFIKEYHESTEAVDLLAACREYSVFNRCLFDITGWQLMFTSYANRV